MRRLLVMGLSIAGLFFSLAATGCGGGADEGLPADTKPGVPIETLKTQMVPLSKVPKTIPKSDATTETPK